MRPLAAGLIVVAALGLGACTQSSSSVSDFKGTQADVAQVVEDLESDAKRHQADQICSDLLARALQEKVAAPGRTCAAEMKKALEDADTFDLKVDAVTVTGSTATAKVSGPTEGADLVRTFQLAKEGNRWRIASFGS